MSGGAGAEAAPTRLTLVGVAGAAALVPLNSTMVAVALPGIADEFDITVGRTSLLVTVYLVAMLIGQPLAGRLTDRLGARRTVTGALVGFAACSVVAAAAPSFTVLVLARAGQAAFASALVPAVQALLRAVTPPQQRGRSFGIFGSVMGVGAAAGPVVGGALVQLAGWPAIFLANLPVVAVAVVASRTAAGEAPRREGPVAPPAPAGDLPAGLLNGVFVTSFAVQALSTLGQYALLLLTPMILDARGWSAGGTGLVLSALTVGMIVTGPPGGRLGDRRGRRLPAAAGLALAAGAVTVAAAAGPGIRPAVLVLVLAVFGVGLGFATASFTTAGIESVPEHRTGSAGGVLATSRYVGSVITSLAVSALVTADASGSREVLVLSAAAGVAAALLAWRLPGRAGTRSAPPAPAVPAGR